MFRRHLPKVLLPLVATTMLLLGAGTAQASSAPSLLAKLKTSVETSRGYERDKFNHWIDADSNGCDTRQEVLFRENLARPSNCSIETGRWKSIYDGKIVTNASDLDVDHMVPLAEAWGSGAKRWTGQQREAFANDLYKLSLVAVTASSNRSKGDSDPAEWLPPKRSYICKYAARWTAVKYRWRLTVDRRERRSLTSTFSSCPRTSINLPAIPRAPVKPAVPIDPGPPSTGTDPRFDTCTEAIDAGYGPYVRGDAEYEWYEDRDNDGRVCES